MNKFIGVILIIVLWGVELISPVYVGGISSKEELYNNEEYYFDLDGDDRVEKIVQITNVEKDKGITTSIFINDTLMHTYKNNNSIKVFISNINKLNKSKEICVTIGSDINNYSTKILIYNQDGKCKQYSVSGRIHSYDNKTGTIKFEYSNSEDSQFNCFNEVIGGKGVLINYSYKQLSNSRLTNISQSIVDIIGDSAQIDYRALNDMVVYDSVYSKSKAFDLKQNEKVKLVSFYKNKDKKYIKVLNEDGKQGWIQVDVERVLDLA